MTDAWVKEFYRNQFELGQSIFKNIPSTLYEKLADELIVQTGQSFQTVLELGGGMGKLSNQLAKLDKDVTMIELVPELCEVAKDNKHENLNIICDDFYDVDLTNTYDLILYIDGFGIGDTTDQLKLLNRINDWLNDDGIALIDIYQPRYWREVDGVEMQIHPELEVKRKYSFDYKNNRMLDTWWKSDQPGDTFTQSLACYTHEEIFALADAAGLTVVGYYPGGKMDYESEKWENTASLNECLAYRVKLKKSH